MRDKQSFFIDPVRGAVSLATLVFLALIAILLAAIAEYLAAAVFMGVGLLFLPSVRQYGSVVRFEERGVSVAFLGRTRLSISWEEIAEVGVAGSRLFGRDTKKRPGTLYLYLSPVSMTEDERFQMMFRFPPKDKIALVFTDKAHNALRLYWSGEIHTYNAGDRVFF